MPYLASLGFGFWGEVLSLDDKRAIVVVLSFVGGSASVTRARHYTRACNARLLRLALNIQTVPQ
jgi:hypothetical protein